MGITVGSREEVPEVKACDKIYGGGGGGGGGDGGDDDYDEN